MEGNIPGKILMISTILFAEKGYAGVSIRDIISTAQVGSVASISYYFGGKKGLYSTILREHFANVHKMFDVIDVNENSPVKKLEMIFNAIRDTYINSPYAAKLLFNEINHPSEFFPEIETEIQSIQKIASDIIKEGIDAGIFRSDIDIKSMVLAMYSAAHFAFLMPNFTKTLLEFGTDTFDAHLKEVQKIFFKGIMR